METEDNEKKTDLFVKKFKFSGAVDCSFGNFDKIVVHTLD